MDGVDLETEPHTQARQTDEEILLRHVNHLSFEYFGSDEGEDNPRWQDDWLKRTQLPKLIKITFDGEAQGFWPEFDCRVESFSRSIV